MKRSHALGKLSKFLTYVLGRQPDEFGLVTDESGYVKIKDLMKVLAEEPGWRHVRLNQIREMIHTTRQPAVEIEKNLIRAVNRSHLFLPEIPDIPPKLLYYPIRQRAYPTILEKGLRSAAYGQRIVVADDRQMAHRLGRRIDPSPVILTVNTHQVGQQGVTIWRFGKQLFLLDGLPVGCFSGPPLPKNRPVPQKEPKPEAAAGPKTPGSFLMDLTPGQPTKSRAAKGSRRRKNEWKRERKRKNRTRGLYRADE